MNKSFVAIAIAAIVAGILTTPAEAVRLRTQPNGISINGLVLNGLALNGRSWQGTSVRGAVEAEALSLIGVELAD